MDHKLEIAASIFAILLVFLLILLVFLLILLGIDMTTTENCKTICTLKQEKYYGYKNVDGTLMYTCLNMTGDINRYVGE